MKLLIDIGNSRLKWCLVRHTACLVQQMQLVAAKPVSTLSPKSILAKGVLDHQALSQFHRQIALDQLGEINQVVLACVAGQDIQSVVMRQLNLMIPTPYQLDLIRVKKQVLWHSKLLGRPISLEIAYSQPELLGVDRWLNMIAASELFSSGFIVISLGSAITIDVVIHGKHSGGAILPGLMMFKQSLFQKTGELGHKYAQKVGGSVPEEAAAASIDWLGHDTRSCIDRGCDHYLAGLIHQVGFMQQHWQLDADLSELPLVVTGGDSSQFVAKAKLPLLFWVEDMVMSGMLPVTGLYDHTF